MRPPTNWARRTGYRIEGWWVWRWIELVFLTFIALAMAVLLIYVLSTDKALFLGDIEKYGTFLLSSIAQGLAAILAVLVTLTLVANQLSAGSYTPRAAQRRITDP